LVKLVSKPDRYDDRTRTTLRAYHTQPTTTKRGFKRTYHLTLETVKLIPNVGYSIVIDDQALTPFLKLRAHVVDAMGATMVIVFVQH